MIHKLCLQLSLGSPIAPPQPVTGGFLHKMLRLETDCGIFAVKLLNPGIMQRPEALRNTRLSEMVNAFFADANYFDVCPSLGGVTEIDGSYCIVYPWVSGTAVYPPHITAEHCCAIGHALGAIHKASLSIPGMTPEPLRQPYDWPATSDSRLTAWDAQALVGLRVLQDTQIISHRDLDPKNVLWHDLRPCVIDWEAAGFVSPWQELIEVLNYWADDKPKVHALLNAYAQHMDLSAAPWEAALAAGMNSMLGWLHYNLQHPSGAEHVRNALTELTQYESRTRLLRVWLNV